MRKNHLTFFLIVNIYQIKLVPCKSWTTIKDKSFSDTKWLFQKKIQHLYKDSNYQLFANSEYWAGLGNLLMLQPNARNTNAMLFHHFMEKNISACKQLLLQDKNNYDEMQTITYSQRKRKPIALEMSDIHNFDCQRSCK